MSELLELFVFFSSNHVNFLIIQCSEVFFSKDKLIRYDEMILDDTHDDKLFMFNFSLNNVTSVAV